MFRCFWCIFLLGGVLFGQGNPLDLSSEQKIDLLNDHAWSLAKSNSDSAMLYADSAIGLSQTANNYAKGLINAHILLGILNKDRGFYEVSVEHSLEALLTAEMAGDCLRVSSCLNNLGVVAQQQGNYEKALNYFQRSLNIEDLFGKDPVQKSIRLYNIGEAFQQLDSLEEAYAYFYNTLLIEEELASPEGILYARLGIGKVDARMGNLEKAASELNKALSLAEEIGNPQARCEIHLAFGELAFAEKNYARAESEFSQALDSAEASGYQQIVSEAQFGLYQLYKEQGKFAQALSNQEAYFASQNALSSAGISGRIGELETQYEVEKKDIQIKRLREQERQLYLESQGERKKRTYILLSLILSIVIFYGNASKWSWGLKSNQPKQWSSWLVIFLGFSMMTMIGNWIEILPVELSGIVNTALLIGLPYGVYIFFMARWWRSWGKHAMEIKLLLSIAGLLGVAIWHCLWEAQLMGQSPTFERGWEVLLDNIWLGAGPLIPLLMGTRFPTRKEKLKVEYQAPDQSEKVSETSSEPVLSIAKGKNGTSIDIPIRELLLVEAADNYCKVHYLIKGVSKVELVRKKMKELEIELKVVPYFFRVHRSYLVNGNMVESISGPSQAQRLHLKHGLEPVRVSRTFELEPLRELLRQAPPSP